MRRRRRSQGRRAFGDRRKRCGTRACSILTASVRTMYIKDVLQKAVADDIAAAVEPYVFIWQSFGAKLANDLMPTPYPWCFVSVRTCASNLRNTFRSRHSVAAQYLYSWAKTRLMHRSKRLGGR